MPFLPIIATLLTVAFVAVEFDFEAGLLCGLIVAILSIQWASRSRFKRMQERIERLEEQLADSRPGAEIHPPTSAADSPATTAETIAEQDSAEATATTASGSEPAAAAARAMTTETGAGRLRTASPRATRAPNPADKIESLLRALGQHVIRYFTDGNLFVRIGILVLFFGIAFLLKYAADNSRIPIEIRFIGAACGGLALLTAGWRLRSRKAVYGLLLQGGGIGVIYITIFAAFRLADLLPPILTFALLVFFSLFTVALAILQDSRSLAIFAVLGGFLAPLLASSGSGNFIGLFSYYAVLNAAVFAVAWFRAWRALNLLGFAFTFGVFVLWVVFDYQIEFLQPGLAFLLLFFLMYSLIGVLYALRQPEQLTGLVDGTLVFGTPVIVSGLMMVMLRHLDYGIAFASAILGFYYIALARFAWRRIGAEFRLLAEALLAIGVVFATLAIPYALEGHWSSAAWALEAAGILWVSIRQNRFYAQCFAILLQVGSGVLFLLRNAGDLGDSVWLNPAFLGGVFIALGGFVSARMLYLQAPGFRLRPFHIPFYLWAMSWWLGSALMQIDAYIHHDVVALLVLFTATAALLVYLDRLRAWNWMPAAINAALLLPMLVLICLYSAFDNSHVLVSPDLYFWGATLTACYWMITRLESVNWPAWVNLAAHTLLVCFVALLLSAETVYLFDQRLGIGGEAYVALIAAGPLVAMRIAELERFPAIARLGDNLKLTLIGALSVLLALTSLLLNLGNSGDPEPLPYLPLLNPVDLVQIAFFVLMLGCLKLLPPGFAPQRRHLLAVLGVLAFVWLTALLIRSLHHYLAIRFDLSVMLVDSRVQSAISILWTLIGMAGMLFASRRLLRTLWIAGAALIGVVLVKMLFVDLSASGTIERIVSFLVVGALLVATGYFSPLPGRRSESRSDMEQSSHA